MRVLSVRLSWSGVIRSISWISSFDTGTAEELSAEISGSGFSREVEEGGTFPIVLARGRRRPSHTDATGDGKWTDG